MTRTIGISWRRLTAVTLATNLALLAAGCGDDASQRPGGQTPSAPPPPGSTSPDTTSSSSPTTPSTPTLTNPGGSTSTPPPSVPTPASSGSTTPPTSPPPASTDSTGGSTAPPSTGETSAPTPDDSTEEMSTAEPSTSDDDTTTTIPQTDLPVANGACAANTGLGKGSSTEYPRAALEDGRVACFTTATATFVNYQGGMPMTDAVVATGNGFSMSGCLINTEGAVHCWDNSDASTTPVIASGALELTGGQGENCALVDGSPKTVKCWSGAAGSPTDVSL